MLLYRQAYQTRAREQQRLCLPLPDPPADREKSEFYLFSIIFNLHFAMEQSIFGMVGFQI